MGAHRRQGGANAPQRRSARPILVASVTPRRASARYYVFEDILWESSSFANLRRRRPMADLQLVAGLVWAREKGRDKCPLIRSARSKEFSQYVYDDRIVYLLPKHQSLGGLLHELAHALGPNDKLSHGPAFRKRCFHLYRTYGEWSGNVEFP